MCICNDFPNVIVIVVDKIFCGVCLACTLIFADDVGYRKVSSNGSGSKS